MDEYYGAYGDIPTRPIPTLTQTAKPTEHIPLPTVTATPPLFEHITSFGQKTLWVGFVLMLLSAITFIVLSWRVAIPKRLFYQLTTFAAVISTFSYYAMATHSGWNFHHVLETNEHKHDIPDTHQHVLRQVFWARFIDWLFTTPLILFNLGALSGVSGSNLANIIVANVATTLTGLFATYGHGKSKWGWYAMSWLAFLTVVWNLTTNARVSAQKRGVAQVYSPLALYTTLIWTVYLVIWGFADISRVLSPNHEAVAYLILDFFAKPVFGFWLITSHQKLQASHIEVDGVWAEGIGHREGTIRVGGDDEDA